MEELGLPELADEEIQELCCIVEEAARKHVCSKVSARKLETLDVSVEVEGSKPIRLSIDVEVVPLSKYDAINAQRLANAAVRAAFSAAREHLRKLSCRSQR